MSSTVRILNVTHVLPDHAAAAGSPQRLPDDGVVKLSFMDSLFIDRVPMQRLFFYEGPDVPPFPAVARSLRSSLAAVVLGVAVHHAVADGYSVWQFMSAWSSVSRSACSAAAAELPLPAPAFDRAAIRYPGADDVARRVLHAIAPALPVARPPSLFTPLDQRRRSFVLRAGNIQAVKQRMVAQSAAIGDGEHQSARPSTFLAVSALVWTSVARAKSLDLDPAADAHFLVPVDLRRRLRSPPGERYFGNCVVPCFAVAAAGDLCDDGAGLARAGAAIRGAVRARLDGGDPLGGVAASLGAFAGVPKERFTVTGSSDRFMAYETDFGWGAPSRVELVSLFTRELVLLLGAGDGAVQVTAALGHAHMDGFAANLMRFSEQDHGA
ncbi:hypothetical protein ACP4OV_027924 [Aristida adscensionis]